MLLLHNREIQASVEPYIRTLYYIVDKLTSYQLVNSPNKLVSKLHKIKKKYIV